MGTDVLSGDEELGTAELRAAAACNDGTGELVELFFSEDLHDIARAKHLCTTCPVRRPCLQGAIERREPCGVWGGELFANGRVLAHKRRRGRPPKHRPAEVIVIDGTDVVVVPEIRSA
ncbi:MAG TPA: WhiB family transcriptional regulator [Acidimicrobiales bacterium]|jgi:WhiB family transcriptional regulator, redox-sensing transcriptional regulator|nr:WhiB family transcriptional regulator [Acidimicrobiales bacterium]